jgi:hypothetical protein
MDHHCPWVANCIGFYNYKYFLNMLFYASLTSIIVVVTSYPVFLAVLANDSVETSLAYFIVTAWILSFSFCIVINAFLGFHIYLLTNQYTTIEYCEKKSSSGLRKISPYNRGCCKNFASILGGNCLLWCVPCFRNLEGDGLKFELMDELKPKPKAKEEEEEELIT